MAEGVPLRAAVYDAMQDLARRTGVKMPEPVLAC